MAEMSESITSWYDSSEGKTGNKIAETNILGNFSAKSQLTDDGGMVARPTGLSPDEMLEMLEAVEVGGESPVPSEEDEDAFIGEIGAVQVECYMQSAAVPLLSPVA